MSKQYSDPSVLCETDWVSNNLNNNQIKILEVDYDVENAYKEGHIPNARMVWWKRDINDPDTRDIINKKQFEDLMSRLGIQKEDELILYGDFNNWFAAFAFWVFKYFGHEKIKIMNGGRKKWESEGRPYTKEEPVITPTNYVASAPNEGIRAYLDDVKRSLRKEEVALVDVRSAKEFKGEITAPPEYPMEHAQRGGHIPGAKNIPWLQALNEDGTFKSAEELAKLYADNGVSPNKHVICYCRIGERSSHTWFVLKYLLGYPSVKNYDGSWTEWGNMIGNPIEK
ncbi:sulfurtransferase [Candidatus Nitrosocosmicus franklandus]|uniref:Sulfurtransferase n=1 Tax=Candidatus Nitrosocosmicus franklandianus TaxID=1798806 RepID=A0A484I588_9ARCH|nr:sulfurtransferase [Candidatus Nitrosocosmicus franklandus]VFJ12837.1 Sulfur carrier protein TtuD [Candidatus Nitrosocosmicus franklandus]